MDKSGTIYISGQKAVLKHFFDLIAQSKRELLITTVYLGSKWDVNPILKKRYQETFRGLLFDAVNRGVKIRVIGQKIIQENPLFQTLTSLGVKIKFGNIGPLRIVLRDNEELLLVSAQKYSEDLYLYRGLVIKNHDIIDFFVSYFEELWVEAEGMVSND